MNNPISQLPPPPLELRVHRCAPPRDHLYSQLEQKLNEAAYFVHQLRNLDGHNQSDQFAEKSGNDLKISRIIQNNTEILVSMLDESYIFLWISDRTRVIYVLHSTTERLFGGYGDAERDIALVRLRDLRRQESQRSNG